jgi:DNA-directed RNA polymerase specialized sigma24 family protein
MQYAYTLNEGDTFTLPGENKCRKVTAVYGEGVQRRIVDHTGEEHDPGIVCVYCAAPTSDGTDEHDECREESEREVIEDQIAVGIQAREITHKALDQASDRFAHAILEARDSGATIRELQERTGLSYRGVYIFLNKAG